MEQRLLLAADLDDSVNEATSLGAITTSAKTADKRIDPDTDVDMYRFTVTAGQIVDFDIDTALNGPGGLGSYLRIFNSAGQQLAFNNDAAAPGENEVGYDAYLRRTFTEGGTYYVGVSNLNNFDYNPLTGDEDTTGGDNALGDYRLIVKGLPVDGDDALSEATSLGSITNSGDTVNSTIDPDIDVDLYRFTVTADQVVSFDLDTDLNGPGGLGSYLRIFNSLGQEIVVNDNAAAPGEGEVGFDAYLLHTFATAGTYYVGISNANNIGYDSTTGDGDSAGGQYSIGDYKLIVRNVPPDGDDTLAEGSPLGTLTSAAKIIDAGIEFDIDVDMYRFSVATGQVVDFDIDTAANGSGGLGSYLRLFNAQGQQLNFNDNAAAPGENQVGFDAYLRHTFATAGTYYVGVSNVNNSSYDPVTGNGDVPGGADTTGDYRLVVSLLPADTDDSLVEANSLGGINSSPKAVNASIDPDIDVDLYAFTVADGQVVDFDIDTAANGTGGLGSYLRLFDGQGQQLASNNDAAAPGESQVGFDAYLRHTFANGGTYYIGVSNFNNASYNPATGNGDSAGGQHSIGDYQLIVKIPDATTPAGLVVTINRTSIPEFNGVAIGTASRSSSDLSVPLTVTLTSSDTGEATVPASVTIPANQSSANFLIAAVDDGFVDGTQTVVITVQASGFTDGTRLLQVTDSDGLWHNAPRPSDVDDDGSLAPIDALLIINFLNVFGSRSVPAGSPPPFFDVNSDNFISPIDALIVINALNNGEGEGEDVTDGISGAATTANQSLSSARHPAALTAPEDDRVTSITSTRLQLPPHDSFDSMLPPPGAPSFSHSPTGAPSGQASESIAATAAIDEFFAELFSQPDEFRGHDLLLLSAAKDCG